MVYSEQKGRVSFSVLNSQKVEDRYYIDLNPPYIEYSFFKKGSHTILNDLSMIRGNFLDPDMSKNVASQPILVQTMSAPTNQSRIPPHNLSLTSPPPTTKEPEPNVLFSNNSSQKPSDSKDPLPEPLTAPPVMTKKGRRYFTIRKVIASPPLLRFIPGDPGNETDDETETNLV